MQNGEQHHHANRHFNPQVSMIQEIPDDVETLKSMYMQSIQEIKVMQKKLQGKDQELQMQKKSLSNLALTVVQQDKHIKNLLQHIEQLKGAQVGGGGGGGGGGSYMDRQQNSMSGISDGAYSAGEVQSQSSGEEEDEYYEDVTGGQAEDEEMYELKQQILNAHDFLKDLDIGDDNSPPANEGKRNRRGSRMNSRTSSPFSQKSLGMSDLASNFQSANSKPPTPPASTRSRGDNNSHRRSITNDNLYGDEENSRINRSRSVQPRSSSRQQYNSGNNGVGRVQSIDSFQDETSSIMSRVEDRVRRFNQGSEGKSYSKNGGSTFRETARYNDEDIGLPSARRTSYSNSRQYRDYGNGGLGSDTRRNVGRLGSRLDSGYSYSGSYGTKGTSRTDSYQLSNGSKRTGSGVDDEFDVGALKDKIAALESEGWENDNYVD